MKQRLADLMKLITDREDDDFVIGDKSNVSFFADTLSKNLNKSLQYIMSVYFFIKLSCCS